MMHNKAVMGRIGPIMDTREYVAEVVIPLFERAMKYRRDRSLIIAAAIVCYQTVDWIAIEREEKVQTVWKRLKEAYPDWEYLDAVAQTHKHRERDRGTFKGLSNPLSRSEQVGTRIGPDYWNFTRRYIPIYSAPVYEFEGGMRKDPKYLIGCAIQAIEAEIRNWEDD
jgi:hypothetical protein